MSDLGPVPALLTSAGVFYLIVEHWLSIVYLHTGALMGAGLQGLGVYEYNTYLPPSEHVTPLAS